MNREAKGTGRIYARGGTWWIDYSFRGKRYRESAKSPKRSDATKLLRKRMSEMATGKVIGPQEEKVTFESLCEALINEYRVNGRRSIDRAEGCMKRLSEFFGMSRAIDVTTERMDAYVVRRRDEDGAALATIARELAILRRMFRLAKKRGRISNVPEVPSLRLDNARKGFLDGAELEAVVAELPEVLRPLVRFAALTGWRRNEVASRTWAHVDFGRGVIRLEPGESKNGEGREFPFGALPQLKALLEEQREKTREVERETGQIVLWVFHRGGRRIKSFRTAWDAACRRAGVPNALFHDLRRTAVRNMERAGVSRSVAMKLSGHRTEAIYRRYAIADSAALAEGVGKLATLHGPIEPRKVVPITEAAATA